MEGDEEEFGMTLGHPGLQDQDFNFTSTPAPPIDCSIPTLNHDPPIALLFITIFFFGLLFTTFGYRCYKGVLFLTGFFFGLVIVFLICQEEDLLSQYGNIGISCLSGFLYGLICVLVPYVGFFTLGFHAGLLLGLVAMVFFPPTYSVWISIIFLLGAGLFGAVGNVCFPGLTLVTTTIVGGAGISMALDYLVEKGRMGGWLWSQVKGREPREFCWFSWLLLGLWPFLVLIGSLLQYFITAKRFTMQTYPYRKREVVRGRLTREERALARQAKYRYLYQVRTAGGDILSQSYVQSLQHNAQLDTLSTHMSTLKEEPNSGSPSLGQEEA